MPSARQIKNETSLLNSRARSLRSDTNDPAAVAKALSDLARCVSNLAECVSDLAADVQRLKR